MEFDDDDDELYIKALEEADLPDLSDSLELAAKPLSTAPSRPKGRKTAKPAGMNLVRERRERARDAEDAGRFEHASQLKDGASWLAHMFKHGAKEAWLARADSGIARKIENLEVRISNDLIRACYNLTLIERRLLAMSIARLSEMRGPASVVTVTAEEWSRACFVEKETAYKQLRDASNKLFERTISFERKIEAGKRVHEKLRWVSYIKYNDGNASATVEFSQKILPLIHGLASEFTHFKLRQVLRLQQVASWQLYQVCAQWKIKLKTPPIRLDILHTALEASPAARASFKRFRYEVLSPAIDEIRARLRIPVEAEFIKENRRVVAVVLHFPRNVF
jgi:hypothetical protein